MHCAGGVCSGGCLLQGVSALGTSAWVECLLRGGGCLPLVLGVSASGPGGVSASGLGVCIAACTEADIPPCEQNGRQVQKHNLRKLRLRAVIMCFEAVCPFLKGTA